MTFLEISFSGDQAFTTVFYRTLEENFYFFVHSRHTSVAGAPVVSQTHGFCAAWIRSAHDSEPRRHGVLGRTEVGPRTRGFFRALHPVPFPSRAPRSRPPSSLLVAPSAPSRTAPPRALERLRHSGRRGRDPDRRRRHRRPPGRAGLGRRPGAHGLRAERAARRGGRDARETARVLIDQAIYFAARMLDEPDQIVRVLNRQDEQGGFFDWVGVSFDPDLTRRNAYHFRVNSEGVQLDAYLTDFTQQDMAWNAVWESAVQRDSLGWSVEMRIPLCRSATRRERAAHVELQRPPAAARDRRDVALRAAESAAERRGWRRWRRRRWRWWRPRRRRRRLLRRGRLRHHPGATRAFHRAAHRDPALRALGPPPRSRRGGRPVLRREQDGRAGGRRPARRAGSRVHLGLQWWTSVRSRPTPR